MTFKLVYLPGDTKTVVCETTETAIRALDAFREIYAADKRPRPRRAKKMLTSGADVADHGCTYREVSFVPKAPYRGVGLPDQGADWGKGVAHYFVLADLYGLDPVTYERAATGVGYVLVSGDAVQPIAAAASN